MTGKALLSASLAAVLAACAQQAAPPVVASPSPAVAPQSVSAADPNEVLLALADRMVAQQLRYNPATAYSLGVDAPDNSRWPDRSQTAIAAFQQQQDALIPELQAIDASLLTPDNRTIHAAMLEELQSERGMRICRTDLWGVRHMGAWHQGIANVARDQPVATADDRAQALTRWAALPAMIDQEIANARLGLDHGYSTPKPVVRRVIKQIESLVSAPAEKFPIYSPAEKSDDPVFKAQFRDILDGPVRAGFRRYLTFLDTEYYPRARETLGVAALPNGRECYAASLRSYTTLSRSPQGVFDLGNATVTANAARVSELGYAAFGTRDLATIAERIAEAPDNRFKSEEELIAFSRDVVALARDKSAALFLKMPAQEMRVEPFYAFMRGTGASSHYEGQVDPDLPAFYRINSEAWPRDTRGSAEITAVHEGYPGHHMQISSRNAGGGHPVLKLTGNSAYTEGWARYSEALAEEAQIYRTKYAPMTRRLWPARGMVVDPGLHVMGWTRQQVIDFIRQSGRFQGAEADDLVDRISIWPGQLTAYDSGGLEIMALRREAEAALGDRFDIRRFHDVVLGSGTVPLNALRANVEAWIARERAAQ